MKKLIFVLLALCLIATACINKEPDVEEKYPKDVSFTEYILDTTSCQWKKLSKDSCNYNQVAIINSNEELEKYIDCTNGNYPEIDFSKYSLLLANGVRCYNDLHNYTNLQQISKQNYVLKVDFQKNLIATLREWQVAIIVNKLDDGSSVVLEGGNAAQINDGDNYDLVNTKWKLAGIVDAKTSVLQELQPKDCVECYTLTFDTDSTFSGFSTTRIIDGEYNIDYTTNSINILMNPLIALEELNLDAELYVEDLRNVFSFSLQENNSKLRIYFNTEFYFLYNKLSQP